MWAASTDWCGACGAALGFVRDHAAKVVVDLGKPSSDAGRRAAEFNPDILILTHSDNDHIGGFGALANAWPPRLREVWVPYEWGLLAEARAALSGWDHPQPEREVQPEQIRELGGASAGTATASLPAAAGSDDAPYDILGHLAEFAAGNRRQAVHENDSRAYERQSLEDSITQVIEQEQWSNSNWPPIRKPEKARRVAKDVVKKSDAILGILASATMHGSRVRYFSTDAVQHDGPEPWTTEGRAGTATIVNAVEVRRLPARYREPARALYLAYELTVQNRRALAVFLWERACLCGLNRLRASQHWKQPSHIPMDIWDVPSVRDQFVKPWGILIWSDGAGESCGVGCMGGVENDLVPWEHLAAMTAPHHGSKGVAHREIWAALADAKIILGREIPVLLVGGFGSQGTAPEYLAVERKLRACTRCRHLGDRYSKTVVLAVDGPTVTVTPACRD
jgi:hypothetical protein